jgi:hypothetical protein
MQVRADGDPEPRARVDVDVRIDAALADQSQLRKALEQRRANLRALPDEHERIEAVEALGERLSVLHVVGEDRDLVTSEPLEARQTTQRIEPIIENRNPHRHEYLYLPQDRECRLSRPASSRAYAASRVEARVSFLDACVTLRGTP